MSTLVGAFTMVGSKMDTKTCNTCEIEFPKTAKFFNRNGKYFKPYCKECQKIKNRKYYQGNKEQILERQREYSSTPEAKKKKNESLRTKRGEDPHLRRMNYVHEAVRVGLLNPERVTKRNKVWNALPYTPWELRKHLEGQFEHWMNWGNRGKGRDKWSLDHVIPQSSFYWETLQDDSFQKCWALSNLRPLCSIENTKKRNRLDATKHN